MSGRKMKYKRLTVNEKLKVIDRLEKGESTSKLAAEFGIGETTVRDIKKHKETLIKFSSRCDKLSLKRKSMKTSSYENLDEAMLQWFNQKRAESVPISGPMCAEQAKYFHNALGLEGEFKASSGWLTRFKNRYGIRELTIQGEKLSADNEAADIFTKEFKLFIEKENLDHRQIYNADETGLYWKCLPSRTLAMKKEIQAPGRKASKERVTVLMCSNATGEHKLKLLVIGKSKTPRCFKNKSMPLHYCHQKSAWMDSDIFKNWFHCNFVKEVTSYLEEQSLPIKAVLLIDNAPSHPNESELKCGDIYAKFLPANVTSVIQPMDQGVIAAVKRDYRSTLLSKLASESVEFKIFFKEFSLLEALYTVKKSWEKLDAVTLARSWRSILGEVQDVAGFENDDVSDANLTKLTDLLKKLEGCENTDENDLIEWFQVDDKDKGYKQKSDNDIVRELTHDTSESESDGCEEETGVVKVSHSQADIAASTLISYAENRDEFSFSDIIYLRNMQSIIRKNERCSGIQKKMTDFFVKDVNM